MLTMNRFNSLKNRIILASFAMTFVICMLFGFGLVVSFDIAEETFFEDHIEADMSTFVNLYEQYPGIATVGRENFEVFVAQDNDNIGLPQYLQNLPDDPDDIEINGELRNLEILQQGNNTFYFVTEETAMDEFEMILFTSVIVIIVVICICAIFLGFMFANRIIKPVTTLADRVNMLERKEQVIDGNELTGMDEIQVLSHAINSFQSRVSELLRRERDFSSDASHELRTPLMGIQAAAENLQVSGGNTDRVMELAGRIEERCKQMQSLIDSMLYLARDPHSLENDFVAIHFLDIINDQLESAAPYIENKGVKTLIIENDLPPFSRTYS